MKKRITAASALLVALLAAPLAGQESSSTRLSLMAGVSEFDLSGVNTATIYALRADRSLHRYLSGEASLSYARLSQDFGESQLFLPEVQIRVRNAWHRLEPYLGLGVGLAIDDADNPAVETDVELGPSAAIGLGAAIDERIGVRIDGRIHSIGWDFAGTIAGLTAGLTITL